MTDENRLTTDNVRKGLRICERHAAGQDRMIVGVVPGQRIECTGVVSGRASAVAWHRLGAYNIVGITGS